MSRPGPGSACRMMILAPWLITSSFFVTRGSPQRPSWPIFLSTALRRSSRGHIQFGTMRVPLILLTLIARTCHIPCFARASPGSSRLEPAPSCPSGSSPYWMTQTRKRFRGPCQTSPLWASLALKAKPPSSSDEGEAASESGEESGEEVGRDSSGAEEEDNDDDDGNGTVADADDDDNEDDDNEEEEDPEGQDPTHFHFPAIPQPWT